MFLLSLLVPFLLSFVSAEADCGRAPCLQLNDGQRVPVFGLGTWVGYTEQYTLKPDVVRAVEWAIDAGYRHFDTAFLYKTEREVGLAVNKKIADGVVKREQVFITTKLWNDRHSRAAVLPALRQSLANLNLSYVDLYLIHCPIGVFPNGTLDNTDYVETWLGMIQARDLGLAKSIGVSNFNRTMIERIITKTGVKPAVLQVEINLNLQQPQLLEYCNHTDIVVTGYTPFGSLFKSKEHPAPPPRVDDPSLLRVANKYNRTVSQVVLRYWVELGVIPIPKSVNRNRIEENIQVFDFDLDEEDLKTLRSYDRNYRTLALENWRHSPYYPF